MPVCSRIELLFSINTKNASWLNAQKIHRVWKVLSTSEIWWVYAGAVYREEHENCLTILQDTPEKCRVDPDKVNVSAT